MEYEIIISIFLNDRIICKVKLNHILVLRLALSSTFQSVYAQTFISFLSSYMPCNLMFTLVVILTFRPCDILQVFVIACLALRIYMFVLVTILTTFRPFYSPAFFRCLSYYTPCYSVYLGYYANKVLAFQSFGLQVSVVVIGFKDTVCEH